MGKSELRNVEQTHNQARQAVSKSRIDRNPRVESMGDGRGI